MSRFRLSFPRAGLAALSLALSCVPGLADVHLSSSAQAGPGLTQAQARELVGEVLPEVERIRAREFKRPVDVVVVDDAAARRHVLSRMERLLPADRIANVGTAYHLLGLVAPGRDLLEAYLEVLRVQAGGFYDPSTGAYYLLDDIPPAMAPAVTAHELTHALEDQYFDLDARLMRVIDDDDRAFALGSVHEGSAMLLMAAFTIERVLAGDLPAADLLEIAAAESERTDVLRDVPPVLLQQILGPYVLGASFLGGDAAAAPGGAYPVERADRAYADPPLSSEQILHPEKYWDPLRRDEPRAVTLGEAGAALGRRWRRVDGGVLGELTLSLLVADPGAITLDRLLGATASGWTDPAAEGWGGDRWELWRRGRRNVVLLGTVWDSARDAAEFAAARTARRSTRLRVAGDRVALVAGDVPRRAADRLLAAVLASLPPAAAPNTAAGAAGLEPDAGTR